MISTIYTIAAANLITILAADVKIDGTIVEAEHFIDYFFYHMNSCQYNGIHLLLNIIFLLICFILRYKSYFKITNIDSTTDDGKKIYNRYRNYVLKHCIISFIFAYIICYLLVKMANSEEIVIIWNIIISPLISFLSSIWFDNEFLIKWEEKYKFLRNPLSNLDNEDNYKSANDHHTEVHVTVNNGDNGTDDKFVLDSDKELSDEKKIEATINRIIEVQKEQSIILERHTTELKDQNLILKNMQTLMKNNIKFELEDMIYEVLDRGYVTPAEDKKIRVKYNDYKANNGNGELEDLYKSRYLELDVHDHK